MEGRVCLFSTNNENCSNWLRVSARPCGAGRGGRAGAPRPEIRAGTSAGGAGRGGAGGRWLPRHNCLRRGAVGPHALALINTPIGWHSRCRQERVTRSVRNTKDPPPDLRRLPPAPRCLCNL